METTWDPDPELVYFNGINQDTGTPATPPVPIADLAKRVASRPNADEITASSDDGSRGIVALLGVI